MLEIGQPAPNLTLPATGAKTVALSQLAGKWVVLYFYPKDNTPGCTNEAIGFRDHHADFAALDAVILGVSRDSIASHEKFRAKYALPFDLLSDADEVASQTYDVIRDKVMYGKPVRGIERSTFLIAPDGTLAAIWRKVKVEGHVEAVLAKLRELAKERT